MTEYTDSFETIPGDWVKRNPSLEVYDMVDRWEAVNPNTIFADEKAQLGTFALRKQTDQLDFDDCIAQTITGVREFDLKFYMGIFYSGETSEPIMRCDAYLDDGISTVGTPSFQSGAGLPNNLFGVSIEYDYAAGVANHTVAINYRRSGPVVELFSFNPSAAEMPRDLDKVQWFGFRLIFVDDEIKLYTDFDNSSVWILKTTIANSAYIEADLTSVALNTEPTLTGGVSDENVLIDNFRLGTAADIQNIDGNIQGLSLGTAEIIAVKALQAEGAQGYATITINDKGLANWSTILSNANKQVVIRDTVYNKALVIGEVKPIEIIDLHTYVITIQHNSRKMLKQYCAYNAVLYSNHIKHVADNVIHDQADALTPVITGYAVTFEKNALDALSLYPLSIANANEPEFGSVLSLYREGPLLDYGTDILFADDTTFFTFKVFVGDVSEISDIKFTAKYEIIAEDGGYDTNPDWNVYVGFYTQFIDVDDGFTSGEDDETLQISHIDISMIDSGITISDMLEEIAGANSSGYKEYRAIFNFESGRRVTAANRDHRYAFDIVNIVIEMNTDQPVSVGQGLIDAASDTNNITFDNVSPAWGLADFPMSEGFGASDQYFVTRWLDDILNTIFLVADTLFTYNQNITDAENQVIFNRDLTWDQILTVLDEVKTTMNAPWWLNPSTNIIDQISIDNLNSTGLTLTRADFVGNPNYVVDPSNIRSKASVVGKNDAYSSDITEQYTLEGGNEEEAEIDVNLTNPSTINSKLAVLVKKHTNAKISCIGILNYGRPEQDYSVISLYKTVALSLDDDNGVEIISHTAPELTIVKIQLKNDLSTGYQDFVTLWLEELIA